MFFQQWMIGARFLFCTAFALTSVAGARAKSLREAAVQHWPQLRIGTAVNDGAIAGTDSAYANCLRLHYQSPSPENAFKWASTQPDEYDYTWGDADRIVAFARAANDQVRGHTMVWHNSIPTWLTGGGFTPAQIRDFLFHHIDTVCSRYQDDAFSWDVVNEAFNDNGSLRDNFWYDQPGIGYATNGTRYIEEAFKHARTAAPNARLIYNDYSIEAVNAKSDAVYAMAQDFLSRGVPLDGIGFQMHISGIDYSSLRNNFKRFNDLGLDLHITEMDVRIPVDTNGNATADDLEAQAEIYWNVLGVALAQPHFRVFQTWGFTDKYSWIPGFYPGYGAALPFDKNYRKKPAYWAIWNALANQAEKLSVLDLSAGSVTNVFSQDTLSAGAGLQLAANGANEFMTLGVTLPFSGAWDVKVGYRTSGASGKFQVAAAPPEGNTFANLGGEVDAYGAGVGTGVTDLGTNFFASAGNWQFRLAVTGKNAAASGYHVTIDYLRITPVLDAANTAPTISNVGDKTAAENSVAGPFTFTVNDAQTPAGALSVQAVSMNPNVLPPENIVLGGSGTNRTVTLTPATNQFGSAAVVLLVSDGTNQTPETFTLTVTPVNTPPLARGTNITVDGSAPVNVDLSDLMNDIETPSTNLLYQAGSAVGGSVALLGDRHTARFTAATNFFGAAAFTGTGTDTGPDSRWLFHYDFTSSTAGAGKSVTDDSANSLTGAIEDFGTGAGSCVTGAPAVLSPFVDHSLAFSEAGTGNGARLEVSLPSATYSLKNADWTLATWFRRNTATNDDFIFHVGSGDGYGGDGDELDLDLVPGGALQLRHYNTGNSLDVNLASGPVTVGEWHHAAVVFQRTGSNSGQLTLYLDGQPAGPASAVTWALDQSAELVLGGVKKGNEARWLNGALADAALYRAALSPGDIAALAGGMSAAHLDGLRSQSQVTLNFPFANHPPTLSGLMNTQIMAGRVMTELPEAADPDSPPQNLEFHLLNAPTGAVINPTNGVITWRPAMTDAGTSNQFVVAVAEAGWQTNILPVADAYVRDGAYAGENFGTDAILTVKQDPNAGFTRESFLRFALPLFPGNGADATLQLFPQAANLPGTHAVSLVTNNFWDEQTVTWSNHPDADAPMATWTPANGMPVRVSLNRALSFLTQTDGLLSLCIYATNSTADGRVDYESRESISGHPPQLSLVYTNSDPLTTTQSFWVTVTSPSLPLISMPEYHAGTFQMLVSGDGGPDYHVQTSTNLTDWTNLFTTNLAAADFVFTVSNQTSEPRKFYRVQLGP